MYIALIDTLLPFLGQVIKYLCFVMYFYSILLDKYVKLTACLPYISVPKFLENACILFFSPRSPISMLKIAIYVFQKFVQSKYSTLLIDK